MVPLNARDLRFSQGAPAERWYMGRDPVPTAFFSALSTTFPMGERFFIDSVRPLRADAPEPLAQEIAGFVRQEALHTREHVAFNAQVDAAGYDTAAIYARTERVLTKLRRRSLLRQLCTTITLEHFTAVFAHELLAEPRRLAAAPPAVGSLWRWHALEEIEHKAVAFDAFLHASRGWSGARRWLFRSLAMIETTWLFFKVVGLNMSDLFAQDQLPAMRTWGRAAAFLVGRGGILSAMVPPYLAWFRPGFHPWRLDNRALAQAAAREFDTAAAA